MHGLKVGTVFSVRAPRNHPMIGAIILWGRLSLICGICYQADGFGSQIREILMRSYRTLRHPHLLPTTTTRSSSPWFRLRIAGYSFEKCSTRSGALISDYSLATWPTPSSAAFISDGVSSHSSTGRSHSCSSSPAFGSSRSNSGSLREASSDRWGGAPLDIVDLAYVR